MKQLLGFEQTTATYTGPSHIPFSVATAIHRQIIEGAPLVNTEAFNERMAAFIHQKGPSGPIRTTEDSRAQTFKHHVQLEACSLELATLHAGDLAIPRPRRLHEHNQSSINIHSEFLRASLVTRATVS